MSKRPTEADLGIDLTPEEQEILSRPTAQVEEDDIQQSETDENDTLVQAAPKPGDKPAEETAEAKATRERNEAGQFVAKPKDGEQAAVVDADKPPKGYVKLEALQEARAKEKLFEERFNTLMEVVNKRNLQPEPKPETQAPVIPDKMTDPLGYIDYIEGRLGKIEGETAAQAKARQDSETEQAEVNQALAVALPQFNEAAAADPTITEQYNALLASMAREIAFVNGIPTNTTLTPAQKDFIGRELTKLEQGHIKFAVASGRNVAEYMREFAASRGIGVPAQAAAPAAAITPPPAPAKTIAERASAQQRHMSIGDLPGSAVPEKISAKDLVKMSPSEFAAFAKKMGDAGLDELFKNA